LRKGDANRRVLQDVERGTFSHRHCVLHDQKNEMKYTPTLNTDESIPHERGSPFEWIEPEIAQYPKSA